MVELVFQGLSIASNSFKSRLKPTEFKKDAGSNVVTTHFNKAARIRLNIVIQIRSIYNKQFVHLPEHHSILLRLVKSLSGFDRQTVQITGLTENCVHMTY